MTNKKEIRIFKCEEILQDLNEHIIERKPFSLIRFGDGGLKFIYAVLNNDRYLLKYIHEKEGIPLERIIDIFLVN